MADVTIKRIEDMESIWGGSFVRARASLAASSFGMNIWNSPPNWESWEHNHADPPVSDDEEEVYTALSGSATLHVAGEEHLLAPGVFARVGATEKRKLSTGAEGAQILCIGGMPGRVYEPLPIVQLGGPAPLEGQEPLRRPTRRELLAGLKGQPGRRCVSLSRDSRLARAHRRPAVAERLAMSRPLSSDRAGCCEARR